MILRAGFVLCLVLALLLSAATLALAKDLAPETRRMAERAFLEGRLDDLENILAGRHRGSVLDHWPLWVRDFYWRGEADSKRPPEAAGIEFRVLPRLPPSIRGGGEDPYPILTALIEDRHRRETKGAKGLPADGPLAALAKTFDPKKDRYEHYYAGERVDQLMTKVYHPWTPTDADRIVERNSRELVSRNRSLAILGLGIFVLLALGIGWRLGRSHTEDA